MMNSKGKTEYNLKPLHEAILWEKENDRISCLLCPKRCLIAEGRAGYCSVRVNDGGVLKTLTYGRVVSAAPDPIEKKPLFHFYPGTAVYSLGTIGCNFRCKHCQNWEIAHARANQYMKGLYELPPEAVVRQALDMGCSGIALTYNEPVLWIEYAIDIFRLARQKGLYTVFVTNGYITEMGLRMLEGLLDAFRVDVKGFYPETYWEIARIKDPEHIFKAAQIAFKQLGMHVEVVTNVIPGVNDSDDELGRIAGWIYSDLSPKVPWHITRFYPYLAYADKIPTPVETLERAYGIGKQTGLEFVYLGNVSGHTFESTYCPSCRKLVIGRIGFYVSEKHTRKGRCAFCGYDLNLVE